MATQRLTFWIGAPVQGCLPFRSYATMGPTPKGENMTINVGDRVAYSVQFLQSVGCQTGPIPAARGTVVDRHQISHRWLVTIDWDDPTGLPPKVMDCNLAHVGPNTRFCAC